MNFKSWLLNENPDEAKGPNGRLNWREGQTFCIFDTYTLISPLGAAVIHESIAHKINECRLAIHALIRKEITPQELNECLTSPSSGYNSVFLESKGNISQKSLEQLRKTVEIAYVVQQNRNNLKDASKKPNFVSYRNMSLKETPEVMLGRIWDKDLVISFWNPSSSVFSQSHNILEFVKQLGDIAKYKYEIQNELLSYEEFIKGKKINNKDFDPSIIHTMAPGEVKSQLQRMMGMTPSKQIDIRNKQLAYTSENHEL